VFLAAAAALGASPSRCIVFEDAQVGIEAALRGGMKVVGVAGTHPRETLGAAHRVVGRLDELIPADLSTLIGI
jgi:beta-phosphoglucomutase-like phosphatase (HAD superfamily)